MDKGIRCLVTGRVQGVCFRLSTREQADLYGLTGWVRNLQDGRVEVIAFGDEQQLDNLKQWLKSGPAMARVLDVESETVAFQEFEGFGIR
jgi:acylphosphatase